MRPDIGIAILAKAPVPGWCKTRLIPAIGAQAAARLQHWLLERTINTALAAAIGPVTVWCAPDTFHPAFEACRHLGGLALQVQPDTDLGDRMRHAIANSDTPAGTLVIGTDCPALSPEILQKAALSLGQHDAVIIPASDGGYVLIGLRTATPLVFEGIAWSTETVMAETRARLASLNWTTDEFASLWDVDRDEDLVLLIQTCPETATIIGPPTIKDW